jgi:hypothetical protein
MSAAAGDTLTRIPEVFGRQPSETVTVSDLVRIRREYLEMPGLVLTLPQVARLWGFSVRRSETLLSVLVADGFLVRDQTRAFRRRRGHLAKAETEQLRE